MISVIMPIYNGEKHMDKAIKSVLNQTYKNIELIIINDGSKDKTLLKSQKYKEKDKRVKLIDSLNLGPGAARNKGLKKAKGRFLAFVDADDWLDKKALASLRRLAQQGNYQIVSANHYRVDGRPSISENNYKTGPLEKTYHSFKTSSSFGYVWGKLYSRSFIEKNNISFSQERKVFLEDNLFNLKALAFKPSYYVLNQALYYYRVHEDSISNKKEDISPRAIRLLKDYEDFLDKNSFYEENLDLFVPLGGRVIAWSLMMTMENDFNFKKLYKKVKYLISNPTSKRLFANKRAVKVLKTLPSLAQRSLYVFIILATRYKLKISLALVFYISYPIFKMYINKAVKT